jgi:Arc/MetJ-type ribon-helix-helix transcriptional regulator
MSDARITVRLDAETQRRLIEEVAATGKNESEVVRAALSTFFARRPRPATCLELANRHRLIGCAKGLPADLSTNRSHFEGFGK